MWANGPLLLAVAMLMWAGSIVTGRAGATLIPPGLFTALRWAGALVITVPFAWPHVRRDWPVLWRRRWVVMLLALLGVVTYNRLVYAGLHDTTAVNALLLQSAMPMIVLLAVFVLFGERPGPVQVVAIGVSIAGVVLIAAEGSFTVLRHLRVNPGDALILLAVASYAVYSAMLRMRPLVNPLSLLLATFTVGTVVLLPMAAAEYAGGARMVVSALSVSILLFAAVGPGFLAYLCFNRGVELVGPGRAGQFMHLIPAFGVVMAVVLLGERLHWFHLAGIGLIGAGLWLAGRGRVSGGPSRPA